VSILLQQQQPRQNQNQTSSQQPRHLSFWTRSWDCWRTWNLTTYDCDSNEDGTDDDTGKTFRILQEVAAYLGPTVLTEDEKMSVVLYWKRHCKAYPHLSQIAKVYLMLSASSVPVENMFSLAGLVKNSRRSSVAPRRLNRLCFVHDSYAKYFHWNNSATVVDLRFLHSDSDISYIKPLHN